jgi:hypothetical protein
MSTTAEKIVIMQAFVDGKVITWPYTHTGEDMETSQIDEDEELGWDWDSNDYQIAEWEELTVDEAYEMLKHTKGLCGERFTLSDLGSGWSPFVVISVAPSSAYPFVGERGYCMASNFRIKKES